MNDREGKKKAVDMQLAVAVGRLLRNEEADDIHPVSIPSSFLYEKIPDFMTKRGLFSINLIK